MNSEGLRKHSEHVRYEGRMLRQIVIRLCQLNRSECHNQRQRFEKNVFIEAFCVHARNLVEFLHNGSSPHKNALLALHYFDGSAWRKSRSEEMDEVYRRVSCEIDHLTTDRFAEPVDKQWKFVEIAEPLLRDLEEFREQVEEQKLAWKHDAVGSVPADLVGAPNESNLLGEWPVDSGTGATDARI